MNTSQQFSPVTGMRQNYVDVLSTSGATKKTNIVPEALFPTPYESATSPQMFTPTPSNILFA